MKDTTQIIILTFCIVMSLTLSISIYVRGHDNSCGNCEIDFVTEQQSGIRLDIPLISRVRVVDLYDGLLDNECIVKWDRVRGYYE